MEDDAGSPGAFGGDGGWVGAVGHVEVGFGALFAVIPAQAFVVAPAIWGQDAGEVVWWWAVEWFILRSVSARAPSRHHCWFVERGSVPDDLGEL